LGPVAGTFEQIRNWTPASRPQAAVNRPISMWCSWSMWWCESSSSTLAEETWRSTSYHPQGRDHSYLVRGDAHLHTTMQCNATKNQSDTLKREKIFFN